MSSTQANLNQDQLNKIKAFFDAVEWAEQPSNTVLILARREGHAYRLDDITPIEIDEVSLTSGRHLLLHPIKAEPLHVETLRELRTTLRDPSVSSRDVPLDLMVMPKHRAVERAVVASGGKNAFVIASSGRAFEYEIDACGSSTDDLGLPDPPAGISVFEGSLHTWGPSLEGDYDAEWHGHYRDTTPEELAAVQCGECPWPPPAPLPEEIDGTRAAQVETDLGSMMKLARSHGLDEPTIAKVEPVLRYLVEMAHFAYAEGLRRGVGAEIATSVADIASEVDMLANLESLLVDAGETCPADYQNGFDWKSYNAMIAEVKQRFSSIFRARDREIETCRALERARDTLKMQCAQAQAGTKSMRDWFERAKKQLSAAVLGGEIDTREVDEILKV